MRSVLADVTWTGFSIVPNGLLNLQNQNHVNMGFSNMVKLVLNLSDCQKGILPASLSIHDVHCERGSIYS